MEPGELGVSSRSYARAALVRIYRQYARHVGWNVHARAVEHRVDLWLAGHTGSVAEAIDFHERRVARGLAARRKLLTATVLLLAAAAVLGGLLIGGVSAAHAAGWRP